MIEQTAVTTPAATDPLAQMRPVQDTITIQQETFTLQPFKFGQVPKVLKHLAALGAYVNTGLLDLEKAFYHGGEGVMHCLALALGKERAYMDEVDQDEGFLLLQKVFRLNLNFFITHVLPLFAPVATAMAEAATTVPESAAASTVVSS